MNLDPRTLLFSIFVVYTLSVLSLFFASSGYSGGKRDGMRKWTLAMFLETLVWVLIAARGMIPDVLSLVLANGLKAASHALILAAIYEFQKRQAPRWQYYAPIALTLVMVAVLINDISSRFIWGGLIYGFQLVLIGRALYSDREMRSGRAWRLLFAGVIGILLVLLLRALTAIFSDAGFAQPQNTLSIHPVQLLTYFAVMATALLGSIGFVFMVKERTDREIMHMAMTDSLTRIPNRRALTDYASRILASRNKPTLAMMMVDVDNFKVINDTYGHPVGDKVLSKIASLLAGRLRGQDFLARYGGEEFCIIAQDTDTEGAMKLAESLREAVASATFSDKGKTFSVTISIGVSFCTPTGKRDLKKVLADADAALYTAKQSGRNKSICHGTKSALP